MKKIINWTFGSVFRTIGRIIAYVLFGLLVAIILSNKDIKLPDILGFYVLKADTITHWTTQQGRIQTTHDGTDSWTSYTNINGDNALIFEPTYPVKAIAFRLNYSGGLNRENTYTFQFAYKPTPDAIHYSDYFIQNQTTGEKEEITCNTWQSSAGYYWFKCTFSPLNSYSSSDNIYIKISFYPSYLTDIRLVMRGFEERKGTNAVITEQTNDIINNNNQNTQEIINNINTANENLLNGLNEQQQICNRYDKLNIAIDNKYLDTNGNLQNNNSWGITDFIKIDINTKIKVLTSFNNSGAKYCFYNINKEKISCHNISSSLVNTYIEIPNNSEYFRSSISKVENKPTFEICKNGNQANFDATNDLIHQINDSDTENALNGYKDFFNLFTNNGHGLTSIVSAPLNAINSLSSSTCSPFVLPLPYMENKNITLPCMRPIYEEYFGNFMILYDTITFGIISYWVILKLFKLIKNFKNPEDEGIEVVDL